MVVLASSFGESPIGVAGWRAVLLAPAPSLTTCVLFIAVRLKRSKSLAGVISILESEDVVSTPSENHLEGKCVDLPKEHNLEAAEAEENVAFPQEERTVSNNLPKTDDFNVSKLFSHFLQNRRHVAN